MSEHLWTARCDASQNFGQRETLSAVDHSQQLGNLELGYDLESVLRFDLRGLQDNFTQATLRLEPSAVYGQGTGKLGAFSEDWSEQWVVWNNLPDNLNQLGARGWTALPDTPLLIDVTTLIPSGADSVSFWLSALGAGNGADFHSRESREWQLRPKLIFEMESPEPIAAPTPEPTALLPSYQFELPDGTVATVTSSNMQLLAQSGILVTGNNRVMVDPTPGMSGSSFISITIRDAFQQPLSLWSYHLTVDSDGMMTLTHENTLQFPSPSVPMGAPAGWAITTPTGLLLGLAPVDIDDPPQPGAFAFDDVYHWADDSEDEMVLQLLGTFADDHDNGVLDLNYSASSSNNNVVSVSTSINDGLPVLVLDFDSAGESEITVTATDSAGQVSAPVTFMAYNVAVTGFSSELKAWGDEDWSDVDSDDGLWTFNTHRWIAQKGHVRDQSHPS